MSHNEVRVIVLFEDAAHSKFIRRLCARLALKPVRFEQCGDSSGVLKRTETEVEALRERKNQKNLGLLIVIDADGGGLIGRTKEVLDRIASTNHGPRRDDENIALIIPALEIENWYVHFCCPEARPIDETRDYKPSAEWKGLEKEINAAARQVVEAWHADPSRVDPPSLRKAREELSRVH